MADSPNVAHVDRVALEQLQRRAALGRAERNRRIVDQAVADGRIGESRRSLWERKLGNQAGAAAALAALPRRETAADTYRQLFG